MTKIRIICWCAYKTKLIVVSHTCLVYVNTLVPHPSKWGYSHGTLHPRVAGGPNFFLPNLFVLFCLWSQISFTHVTIHSKWRLFVIITIIVDMITVFLEQTSSWVCLQCFFENNKLFHISLPYFSCCRQTSCLKVQLSHLSMHPA